MKAQLIFGDSSEIDLPEVQIDLLLSCPPYFHPKKEDTSKFGVSPKSKNLPNYSAEIGSILEKWYTKLAPDGVLVLVKTDFWYQNKTYLVGFELARYLQQQNIPLFRHWIWQHSSAYSPYAPSFANIFVFGKGNCHKKFSGIIDLPKHRNAISNLHYLEIYEFLIECFSKKGDTVFDPFAGTGSVLKAAFSLGRNSVGIEISKNQLVKAEVLLNDISLEVGTAENMVI